MEDHDGTRNELRRSRFFAAVDQLRGQVFETHPEIVDHRAEFPWLTGSLGDPFQSVWFLAENPSLTQVQKARGSSREVQWSVSRGDHLFRKMLAKHGFKAGSPLEPGGWRCYITDVIKSADFAKEWNRSTQDARRLVAEAWAPVLRYELENGDPRLLVVLGRKTEELLRHLQRRHLLPALPPMRRIDHYSYIAMRPDRQRGLGPAHPQRVAEWDEVFGEIARGTSIQAEE